MPAPSAAGNKRGFWEQPALNFHREGGTNTYEYLGIVFDRCGAVHGRLCCVCLQGSGSRTGEMNASGDGGIVFRGISGGDAFGRLPAGSQFSGGDYVH